MPGMCFLYWVHLDVSSLSPATPSLKHRYSHVQRRPNTRTCKLRPRDWQEYPAQQPLYWKVQLMAVEWSLGLAGRRHKNSDSSVAFYRSSFYPACFLRATLTARRASGEYFEEISMAKPTVILWDRSCIPSYTLESGGHQLRWRLRVRSVWERAQKSMYRTVLQPQSDVEGRKKSTKVWCVVGLSVARCCTLC